MVLTLVQDRPRLWQDIPPAGGETVTAHVAAGDPHPVYTTAAELSSSMSGTLDSRFATHGADVNAHTGYQSAAQVASAITAHAALADPHSVYTTAPELAAGITAHEAAADPHTGYVQDATLAAHTGDVAPHAGLFTPIGRKVIGPYKPGSYSGHALQASGRVLATVNIPNPGFTWIPLCFAMGEIKSDIAGTRPALSVRITGLGGAQYARGCGVNAANVFACVSAVPWFDSVVAIAAGTSPNFVLTIENDFGAGWTEVTALNLTMSVLVVPV